MSSMIFKLPRSDQSDESSTELDKEVEEGLIKLEDQNRSQTFAELNYLED
jgi:hypothetical protein